MAQWELSPAFMSVRKRLGNMVFYNRNGEIHARKRPERRKRDSPAQAEVIDTFKRLIGDWRCLDGVMRESWRAAAGNQKKHGSGYTLFMGANVPRRRRGEPLELSRPLGQMPLQHFFVHPGDAPGEIVCEFALSNTDTCRYVSFFTQKRENGLAVGELTRIDKCPDSASPCTLGGLEPGCEYYVYAVVTENAYLESKSVSPSRGAVCKAAG